MRDEERRGCPPMPTAGPAGEPIRLPPESFDCFLALLDEPAPRGFKKFGSGQTRWELQHPASPAFPQERR